MEFQLEYLLLWHFPYHLFLVLLPLASTLQFLAIPPLATPKFAQVGFAAIATSMQP
jgi:hypothetical protein